MGWNGQAARAGALSALSLLMALGGCSGNNSLNMDSLKLNLFGKSADSGESKANAANAALAATQDDVPCPEVKIRNGAATLMIGDKPGAGEPAPLDVRYQGSIIDYARECHLNSGLLTIKVGVEGRIITGPAGGPGTVNVPLRIAVVHEGINPTTVVTKFAIIPVTVANAVDRVTFTHVEPDLAFPLPRPLSVLDHYVVYVGFDPLAAQPQKPKRPVHRTHAKRIAKPKAAPPVPQR
jgi:hypothetical protein